MASKRFKHDVSNASGAKSKFVPQKGVYPRGFRVGGSSCGVKKNGALDLAILISTEPCNAAAVFTKNVFQAAPVKISKETLETGKGVNIRGLVVNSGCANAVTGDGGMKDAEAMRDELDKVNGTHRPGGSSLVMSTGVIGQRLPMNRILDGIHRTYKHLGENHDHWIDCAKAICTTDTFPKLISREFGVAGHTYRIAGMSKGAGMVHPHMATLLGFMATDAPVQADALQKASTHATDKSFNCISIDGDMSTNDTVAIFANGAGRGPEITKTGPTYDKFEEAVVHAAQDLAKLVVRDAEGATKFVTITVEDARSVHDAKTVASTIATSALVKTALYGQDANWGRILCATGYAGVPVDPAHTNVSFVPTDHSAELRLLVNGEPENVDEVRASEILAMEDLEIRVSLGTGGGHVAQYWTCDFSHEV